MPSTPSSAASLLETDPALYAVRTNAPGPAGSLPLTEDLLRHAPSGDVFGMTQDVGMGWDPAALNGREFLILEAASEIGDS